MSKNEERLTVKTVTPHGRGRTSLPYETALWFRDIGVQLDRLLGSLYFAVSVLVIIFATACLTRSWLAWPSGLLLIAAVAKLVHVYGYPRRIRKQYSEGKTPVGEIPGAIGGFFINEMARMRFEDHAGLQVIVPDDPQDFDAVVLLEDPAVKRLQGAVVGRYLKGPLRHSEVVDFSTDNAEKSGFSNGGSSLIQETVETKRTRGGYRPAKWMNLPLWELTNDELQKVVETAPIYVDLTDRAMRKKRVELAVIAIATLTREIRDLEQKHEREPDDVSRRRLGTLRTKNAARQRVAFVCERFYNASNREGSLSEKELAQFHNLLPNFKSGKNDWINNLSCGAYAGVSDELEQTAIGLGYLPKRPVKKSRNS